MGAKFSYGEWIDITDRGTSGDQVHDILASWKDDAFRLLQKCNERDTTIKQQAETIRALRLILARVRQVGDHLAVVANNPDSTKHSTAQAVNAWYGVSNKAGE